MTEPGTDHVYLYFANTNKNNPIEANAVATFGTPTAPVIVLNYAYFNDPKISDDYKIQTLIHNFSHSLVRTVDHAYGSDCYSLFPFTGDIKTYKATQNADSVSYFVMTINNKFCS